MALATTLPPDLADQADKQSSVKEWGEATCYNRKKHFSGAEEKVIPERVCGHHENDESES